MKCLHPFYIEFGVEGRVQPLDTHGLSTADRAKLKPMRCGRCMPCRIYKSITWTARNLFESRAYEQSSFVTLTYADEHLPLYARLDKPELVKFIKRLRRRFEPKTFRYFCVGEYGTDGQREYNPHYHCLLYGLPLSMRETVKDCWKYGRTSHTLVEAASAKYVCQYTIKKWTKGSLDLPAHLTPEFFISSRRDPGGIGTKPIEEFVRTLRAARKLKDNEPYDGPMVTALRIDGRNWPLDTYMFKKINDALGFAEKDIELAKWQQQEMYFTEKLHGKTRRTQKADHYREAFWANEKQEARNKLFTKRRTL